MVVGVWQSEARASLKKKSKNPQKLAYIFLSRFTLQIFKVKKGQIFHEKVTLLLHATLYLCPFPPKCYRSGGEIKDVIVCVCIMYDKS